MALVRLGEGVLIFMDYKLNCIFFNIIKSLPNKVIPCRSALER
jgi:hypothetical protein